MSVELCWACWRVVAIRSVLLHFAVLRCVLLETHEVNSEVGTTNGLDDFGDDVFWC